MSTTRVESIGIVAGPALSRSDECTHSFSRLCLSSRSSCLFRFVQRLPERERRRRIIGPSRQCVHRFGPHHSSVLGLHQLQTPLARADPLPARTVFGCTEIDNDIVGCKRTWAANLEARGSTTVHGQLFSFHQRCVKHCGRLVKHGPNAVVTAIERQQLGIKCMAPRHPYPLRDEVLDI